SPMPARATSLPSIAAIPCSPRTTSNSRRSRSPAAASPTCPWMTPHITANAHLDAVKHHEKSGADTLVFMHAVKDGPADRSFGLQVAALAGLPKTVVRQARARLAELEQQGRDAPSTPMTAQALDAPQQIGLFAPSSAALEALSAIEPDELTPRQALEALYRLKSMA